MQVVFYNNSSGNEHVTKNLTEVRTANVKLLDTSGVRFPILQLYGKSLNVNYCYIEDFGRYYYVSPPVQIRNNLWQYSLRCDPLMSFKEQTKANKAILKRTAQDEFANLYLPDDKRMVTSESFTRYKEFPFGIFSGFENLENPGIYNYLVSIASIDVSDIEEV